MAMISVNNPAKALVTKEELDLKATIASVDLKASIASVDLKADITTTDSLQSQVSAPLNSGDNIGAVQICVSVGSTLTHNTTVSGASLKRYTGSAGFDNVEGAALGTGTWRISGSTIDGSLAGPVIRIA